MNTDGHGWDDADQTGGIAAVNRAAAASTLSDPCSIRVSSVAQEFPRKRAKTSWTRSCGTKLWIFNAVLARTRCDYTFWLDADTWSIPRSGRSCKGCWTT